MKSKKALAALLAATLALSTAFVGCSKTAKTDVKPSEEKLDADQTINLIGYDYASLDPSQASDTNTFTTFQNVYEGLMVEVTENGVVHNVLAGASKMEKSADGLTYTFTIRDSKWSDGKPVTAKDYEYSWKRLTDPKNAADYMMFMDEIGVKNGAAVATGKLPLDELGVKAKDDKTLVVTLEKPTPVFEAALSFKGIVPAREDIAKKLGDQYGIDWKNMPYNGAFTITEYQKGSKIVYTKNDSYWDAKNVKLKTANCSIVAEQATLAKMFEAGELDQSAFSQDYLAKFKAAAEKGQYQHITGVKPTIYYYVFNTKSKVLSNPKVRLAFSLSYDRELETQTIFKRYIPARGLVTPQISINNKEYRKEVPEPLKTVKDDPKKLLADGLKELGMDSDPSKVTINLLFSQATSSSTANAQFLQNQWQKNLGVNVKITHTVDGPTYFKERTKGNFDICAGGWGADYNDLNSFFPLFMADNGNNNGKYSNPEYDKLVKDAAAATDPAKRLELYKKAEQILIVQDAAIAPDAYADVQTFRQNWVKGVYLPLFNGLYYLKNAYISGKEK